MNYAGVKYTYSANLSFSPILVSFPYMQTSRLGLGVTDIYGFYAFCGISRSNETFFGDININTVPAMLRLPIKQTEYLHTASTLYGNI